MKLRSPSIEIGEMCPGDWEQVRAIYEEGIQTGNATFETSVPDWVDWDASHLEVCRLVARCGDMMAGWAALSPVSDRCVYGGVAEASVYVSRGFRGHSVGHQLLSTLVIASEDAGLWTLQAGIFPENIVSLRLFEKAGFRRVGVRRKLGRLKGRWQDVVLMERRSRRVGVG